MNSSISKSLSSLANKDLKRLRLILDSELSEEKKLLMINMVTSSFLCEKDKVLNLFVSDL